MTLLADPRIAGLVTLIRAALRPPAGAGRIALALSLGVLCHATFAAGVLAMIAAMFFGLSESLEVGYRLSPRGHALRTRRLQQGSPEAKPQA